jgi:hypothetical protein
MLYKHQHVSQILIPELEIRKMKFSVGRSIKSYSKNDMTYRLFIVISQTSIINIKTIKELNSGNHYLTLISGKFLKSN